MFLIMCFNLSYIILMCILLNKTQFTIPIATIRFPCPTALENKFRGHKLHLLFPLTKSQAQWFVHTC